MADAEVHLLGREFEGQRWPVLSCPTCEAGRLEATDIQDFATRVSLQLYERDDYPLDIEGVFIGRLVCSNHECGDSVAVSGDYRVGAWTRKTVDDPIFGEIYRVRTLLPPLPLMDLRPEVPHTVAAELNRCASLIWTDAGAGLWALRRTVEQIMDDKQIPATTPNGKFKGLDKRLQEFRANASGSDLVAADFLESVKWVGNEGTHSSGSPDEKTAIDTALDMVGILKKALDLLYPEDISAAQAHAAKIIANKGYVPPQP